MSWKNAVCSGVLVEVSGVRLCSLRPEESMLQQSKCKLTGAWVAVLAVLEVCKNHMEPLKPEEDLEGDLC